MIKEYIEREIVIEKCNKLLDNADSCPEPHILGGVRLVRDLILTNEETRVPAADVEPVKHGKWTGFPNNNVWSIKCSECHRLLPFGTLPEEMEYCSHCGARMDGGNK